MCRNFIRASVFNVIWVRWAVKLEITLEMSVTNFAGGQQCHVGDQGTSRNFALGLPPPNRDCSDLPFKPVAVLWFHRVLTSRCRWSPSLESPIRKGHDGEHRHPGCVWIVQLCCTYHFERLWWKRPYCISLSSEFGELGGETHARYVWKTECTQRLRAVFFNFGLFALHPNIYG